MFIISDENVYNSDKVYYSVQGVRGACGVLQCLMVSVVASQFLYSV